MNTKDNMITDISAELEKEFGVPGTPERAKFDEEAYAFYLSLIHIFRISICCCHI